eukprot:m.609112 g.609112  ORF g.609112 m.609112 type:complete len:92 (-) comp58127_c0_seq22:17-292(-)
MSPCCWFIEGVARAILQLHHMMMMMTMISPYSILLVERTQIPESTCIPSSSSKFTATRKSKQEPEVVTASTSELRLFGHVSRNELSWWPNY